MRAACVSYNCKIYIAGDYERACQICEAFCTQGFCVNISKREYIYKFGRESGVVVELINYARFKRPLDELRDKAVELANDLINGLNQGSCTVMDDDVSCFLSRRDGD